MSSEEAAPELPPGWKTSHDKRTGKTFYVNLVTRERTWFRPLRNDEPRDFYRKFDRKSGRIYYVNFATKKTCWKLPPRAVVKDIRELKITAADRQQQSPEKQQQQQQQPQQRRRQQQQQQRQVSPVQQTFENADANGDGVLDRDEFAELIRKARSRAVGAGSPSASSAAQHRLPVAGPPNSDRASGPSRSLSGASSPSVHISRNGSIHISPGDGGVGNGEAGGQQQDFPDVEAGDDNGAHGDEGKQAEQPGLHSTDDYVQRIREAGDRASADADAEPQPDSRPLYPTDSSGRGGGGGGSDTDGADEYKQGDFAAQQAPAVGSPGQRAQDSAAYHGATHAKSGTSTLAAHGPDPTLATMHHDTEALDQDNQILRAQCGDIRSELDGFRAGLHDSLSEVAALLETLSGIENRHTKAAASSPRRLRYGRDAKPALAIENGPGGEGSGGGQQQPHERRSPAVHISRRGSVTINT